MFTCEILKGLHNLIAALIFYPILLIGGHYAVAFGLSFKTLI